ncbi:CPBP family intramembrane glutamic endopeptidase [Bdellovibrio sp. HCB337]|uniref:CPBP family intramembrane glutamic endopeptidase n=1 Tax=Bdellovibrio sp. HCB337 TaxID=3394358 RepID=UPI0039A679D8
MLAQIISSVGIFVFSYLFFVISERPWAFALMLALTIASFLLNAFKNQRAFLVAVFSSHLTLYLLRFIPYGRYWPHDFFIVCAVTFLALKYILKTPFTKPRWSWKFTKPELISVAIITLPSILILLWYYSNHREVADKFPLPAMPAWVLPFAIVGVAAVNGLREELLYRILYLSTEKAGSKNWFLLFNQAVLFGFLHFAGGFPQGWLGVLLTGTWGLAIGIQFVLFRSATLSWLTHSLADAIMFSVIVMNRTV